MSAEGDLKGDSCQVSVLDGEEEVGWILLVCWIVTILLLDFCFCNDEVC